MSDTEKWARIAYHIVGIVGWFYVILACRFVGARP